MCIGINLLALNVADLVIKFFSQSKKIEFDIESSVLHYKENDDVPEDFFLEYSLSDTPFIQDADWSFVGKPDKNSFLNYSWYILNEKDKVVIKVEYEDHIQLKEITAVLDLKKGKGVVAVVPLSGNVDVVKIDPLIHPLGSLLLLYLVHQKGGLLMHASGIVDQGNAYVFTGVSGIGKSTMCRLWKECGARAVNDDRVVLRLQGDDVIVYNNPMPYYAQFPVQSTLNKIFLLKQSPENYIKPLKGVFAYSRVLGNFIQQFYDKDMIRQHLEYIEKVLLKVEVYELGFKPDYDIVKLVRAMD
ncbi:hypothetical protein [Plebeiibacterium marinum]|uniref:Uncharacterized protein n=1 Tax=Plebeiibacterium marinum TaxID=2992111 RepID=A0AAE3MED5_9BACT|nr:hypothetical protein [Plebeiobacterium marinum]MCW3805979.1 hypothetical protein [Plebeiobacterium marinum]